MKDSIQINKLYSSLRNLYYRNKTGLGFIRWLLITGALFVLLIGLQTLYFFGQEVRATLVFLFLILCVIGFVLFIGQPLFQRIGWFNGVSKYKINSIVQKHFPELGDRFLNLLELKETQKEAPDNALLRGSIKQKLNIVNQFPLKRAFSFTIPPLEKRALLVFLALFSVLVIFKPGFLARGYFQYTHYHQEFSPAPDFAFQLVNDSLVVKKGDPFTIRMKLAGDHFPSQLSVMMNGHPWPMKENPKGTYRYTIGNVYHDLPFQIKAGKYFSDVYRIKCLPVPVLRSFSLHVNPPGYTAAMPFVLTNQGDAVIPYGSRIHWNVHAVDANSVAIVLGASTKKMRGLKNGTFRLDTLINRSNDYYFRVRNSYFTNDGLIYHIKVLNDEYPDISVQQVRDSVQLTSFYFHGRVSDDYGLRNVRFHVTGNGLDSTINVSIHRHMNPQDFFYGFTFQDLKPGIYQYWFTVADNDLLHHFKEKQSQVFTFRFPGFHELEAQNRKGYQNIEDQLYEGKSVTREIQNGFRKMRDQMVNGQLTDWEKKQISEGIKSQNNQLKKLMNSVSQENRQLNRLSKNFSQLSPGLLEKQEQLEKLMDQLYSGDLKKLFQELNDLLNKFDQKKFNQLTRNIDYRLEDLNKQLDRNIALLKKMQVQKAVEDIRRELDNLSEKQGRISDKLSRTSHMERDSLQAMIDHQNSDIEKTFSAIDSVMNQNSKLDVPYSINRSPHLQKSIQEGMKSLGQKRGSRSKMQDLSDHIRKSLKALSESMNKSMVSSQMTIDWVQVRRIQYLADNILAYSFQQEKLMDAMSGISALDPSLTGYLDRQKELRQYEKQLRDTLYLLSKQTPQISVATSREALNWKYYTEQALSDFEDSKYQDGRVKQQFSMASANNLALYLSEALIQLKRMMKNSQPGDGSCKNPGGNNSSIPGIAEIQKQLKAQMERMVNDLKNGSSSGNEQIGKMLKQQEIIDQAIREQLLKGDLGPQVDRQLKEVQQLLQQNREDLLSKNVTQQTVKRQNLIFEHLLDAQNARLQRNSDNERESETAKNQLVSHPKEYFLKDHVKGNELDIISNSNWSMNYFYREKLKSYLKNINGQ